MGKYAARKFDEYWWDICACLLAIGVSGPAFRRFYNKPVMPQH